MEEINYRETATEFYVDAKKFIEKNDFNLATQSYAYAIVFYELDKNKLMSKFCKREAIRKLNISEKKLENIIKTSQEKINSALSLSDFVLQDIKNSNN